MSALTYVEAIQHVAPEIFQVHEHQHQTVHLVCNPEISKVNVAEWGGKNTPLQERERERGRGRDGGGGGGGGGEEEREREE